MSRSPVAWPAFSFAPPLASSNVPLILSLVLDFISLNRTPKARSLHKKKKVRSCAELLAKAGGLQVELGHGANSTYYSDLVVGGSFPNTRLWVRLRKPWNNRDYSHYCSDSVVDRPDIRKAEISRLHQDYGEPGKSEDGEVKTEGVTLSFPLSPTNVCRLSPPECG